MKNETSRLLCIKSSLLALDFIFGLSGVGLACVGGSVALEFVDVAVVVREVTSHAAVVLAIVGGIVFFLSVFGCIAVIGENNSMIKGFTVIMCITFTVEIGVGLLAYFHRGVVHSNMVNLYLKTLRRYSMEHRIKISVDKLQKKFECCGAMDYTDWFNTTVGKAVPDSCCIKEKPQCGSAIQSHAKDNIHVQGCIKKMDSWIWNRSFIIGGIGVGLGIAQVIAMIFSCLLLRILITDYEEL
ncbi:CD63 antigen-like [Acipenser oxyrinchus oxyrinchus]|uniref:Tetraspanin n=1 Tax=Acipenser oxyrinchus oxyrinchus TaxID=40147 RepID=A0AAD8DBD7_ACIOX|nr:CD63 antigen-like [Acipenser oxyrinchus oxyrinchus]